MRFSMTFFKHGLMAAVLALPFASGLALQTREIVGGELAQLGDVPFQVSVQLPGSEHMCGGSLLNNNTVLTAGHCFIWIPETAPISIRAGSLDFAEGGVVSRVITKTLHPEFYSDQAIDAAIIKLETPIAEDAESFIGYAKLPEAGTDPAAGTVSLTAGWGALDFDVSGTPRKLRKVKVPIVDRETCIKRYDSPEGVEAFEHQICAATDEGGKGVCFGDSGGPLINQETGNLIGIAVSTHRCGDYVPDRYTRVSTIVAWIQEQLS